MKRKRGNVDKKPTKSAVLGSNEAVSNANDKAGLVDLVYSNFDSRREIETPRADSNLSGWQEDPNSLRQMVKSIITDLAKGMTAEPSRGFSSTYSPTSSSSFLRPQGKGLFKENSGINHQDPRYKAQELKAALSVIKKIMKLDAAEPFNVPVDPIALGIPDYFDVIDTPMDFGTICNSLENGSKYMNSEDVYKDVVLIWDNCCKYNSKDSHILELMNRVKINFMKNWTAAGLYRDQQQPVDESSILRRRKRGKAYPMVPVTDSPAHLQQEAGLNLVHDNQPLPISILADQPEKTPSQSQPSPQQGYAHIDSTIIQKKRQGRGLTRCLQSLNTTGRIVVATNELGQPIGPEAAKLTSFLGVTARDGNLAPQTYPSWRMMPDEKKETMWQKVLSKFDIDPNCRSWVLTSIGLKWGNFRFHLKANHYDTHATDAERLADRDERVLPDQWSYLVSLWSSEKWKKMSAINKANRAKVKFTHASGKKSFARIREEERAKRPDGKEPSQSELFIMTRTRKNGEPVNEATAAVISQLRESTAVQEENLDDGSRPQNEVYTRVMGPEKKGGMCLHGFGASPSHRNPSYADAVKMASEANSEVREIKEKVVYMEQTCAQMAAQMSAMMSMMASMQKSSSGQHIPDIPSTFNVPEGSLKQPEATSTSQHALPFQKTRGRKKRS